MVVAWGAAAAVLLWQSRSDVRSGVDALEVARDELSPADLVEGVGIDTLDDAQGSFASARDRVRSPWISPLRVLPVVGRQIRAVDAMSDAAADVVGTGVVSIEEAQAELERDPTASERVDVMRAISGIAEAARVELETADLGPDEALVGPLARARDEFSTELTATEESLGKVSSVATAMADLFEGPSRYLLLAANNAEMRAGSGAFLQAGPLVAEDGSVEVGDMVPTGELRLPPGAVPLDPDGDLAQRWSVLAPSEEWRNLAASPSFDVTAPVAAQMWTAATGESVDGVLAVDPVALQALLAATGPVEVDGVVIDETNVLPYLLHDQYLGLDYGDPAQAARRDRLGAITAAVIGALDEGDYDTATLVEELVDAAEGRHILAWSDRAVEQTGWEAAGIDGALGADSLMVSVLNRGANKLDPFLDVDAELDLRTGDEGTDATVRLTLTNRTPEGEPPYVAGPHPDTGLAEGAYRGIVAVNVPGAAIDPRIAGVSREVTSGADGPTRVVAGDVELARGDSVDVEVTFRLPPGVDELAVEPSARVPATTWAFEGDEYDDAAPQRVKW